MNAIVVSQGPEDLSRVLTASVVDKGTAKHYLDLAGSGTGPGVARRLPLPRTGG
jgi:hypothetical protein